MGLAFVLHVCAVLISLCNFLGLDNVHIMLLMIGSNFSKIVINGFELTVDYLSVRIMVVSVCVQTMQVLAPSLSFGIRCKS